jgi:uncharacterized protein (DUF1778 family)
VPSRDKRVTLLVHVGMLVTRAGKADVPNEEIEIRLTEEEERLIQELAKLKGQSFQDTLDEVCNAVLEKELPKAIEAKLRK